MSLILRLRRYLNNGHERTILARKNVLLALVFKGVGVFIGFMYFPLSLSYLDPIRFGIFLTMASMIDWFGELDIGIGNGLRNRLGEAIADGDFERGRGYVSTAYFFVGSIFSGVALIVLITCYFLPWSSLINADPSMNSEIALLAMLMFGAFAIRFISSLIFQVFYALQRTAMVDFFSMLSKVSFLFIIIYLIYFTEKGSLLSYGVAKAFTFALVPLIVGLYYFRGNLRHFRPSFQFVRKEYFNDLFSLGFQFFVINLSIIVIYTTNNFLIARFASLQEVPLYEAAHKLLSVFLMLFLILTNQLWSANLDAYKKGELSWMKKALKALKRIWLVTIIMIAFLVLASPYLYKFWLDDRIQIPLLLTMTVGLSVIATNWVNLHNLVLNGAGKIRLQMIVWIIACMLNIPLSIFFAVNLDLGTIGIVLGTFASLMPMAIISPIQVHKILHLSDQGIWSR